MDNPAYSNQQMVESTGSPVLDMVEKDPVMNLLGKRFEEIKQVLGEPDEQGYSGWLGPHYYILYRHKKGDIRFCSPEGIENKIAISINLGPGQEVLGAKVGMLFPEIIDILGTPDFGPEPGMDNLYYMEYFFGEPNHQTPEVFISFSAVGINSPTHDVFIKWEDLNTASNLSYMLSHLLYGLTTTVVAASLGHPSIYDTSPHNDYLAPTEQTTEMMNKQKKQDE